MGSWQEIGDSLTWDRGPRKINGILAGTSDSDVVNLKQFRDGEESYASKSQLFIQKTSLDRDIEVTVPSGYNAIAYDTYTVNGNLTIEGEMHVVSWPS